MIANPSLERHTSRRHVTQRPGPKTKTAALSNLTTQRHSEGSVQHRAFAMSGFSVTPQEPVHRPLPRATSQARAFEAVACLEGRHGEDHG